MTQKRLLLRQPVDEAGAEGASDGQEADLDLGIHGVEHLDVLRECLDGPALHVVRAVHHDQSVRVLVVPASRQTKDRVSGYHIKRMTVRLLNTP